MQKNEKEKPPYEEVSLSEYVRVIIKRKKIIQRIILLSVLFFVVISFVMPKVYKIETSVEIGNMKKGEKFEPLEDPLQLKKKIDDDIYGVLVRKKMQLLENEYPKIKSENIKGINLVMIGTESSKPEQAKTILTEINSIIMEEHFNIIKSFKELTEKNIKTYEEKIKLLNDDVVRIENKIKFAEEEKNNLEAKTEALQKVVVYRQDPGSQFALFETKEKIATKKTEIEEMYSNIITIKTAIESANAEINYLKSFLDEAKSTRIVKSPNISEKPVRPNLLINILAGFLLGVILGLTSAFSIEWWEKNKKEFDVSE